MDRSRMEEEEDDDNYVWTSADYKRLNVITSLDFIRAGYMTRFEQQLVYNAHNGIDNSDMVSRADYAEYIRDSFKGVVLPKPPDAFKKKKKMETEAESESENTKKRKNMEGEGGESESEKKKIKIDSKEMEGEGGESESEKKKKKKGCDGESSNKLSKLYQGVKETIKWLNELRDKYGPDDVAAITNAQMEAEDAAEAIEDATKALNEAKEAAQATAKALNEVLEAAAAKAKALNEAKEAKAQ